MNGILLIAFGKSCYGYAAYNLAISIKHFDPAMQITVLHDGAVFSKGNFDMSVFDNKILLEETGEPAKIKAGVYKYLPYENNLILDVDGICLKSLQPLMDRCIASGKEYLTYIYDTYTKDAPNALPHLIWAYKDDIWNHFNLNGEVLPATQSSVQFIKKGEHCENIFKKLNENLANPLPLEKLRYQWGGTQPDELYLDVTLAQLNIVPDIGKDSLFFADHLSVLPFKTIREDYFVLSLYGARNKLNGFYKDWYDRLMITFCSARGLNHKYKSNFVLQDKHADQKTRLSNFNTNRQFKKKNVAVNNFSPQSALQKFAKIESTQLINSSLLIQTYPFVRNHKIHVTNWLNGSMIEFNGKKYFCYRMEARPYCRTTKLAMCLLDERLQPIKETNVLLEVHSNLRGYEKGFHVEDPRLFIFNNELHLSYTDGYQMGQAKIDPDTLQASESFYIDKPTPKRTEKNWTFFEHENKLYAVYTILPHTIFEMNGNSWTQVYQQHFPDKWQWGEMRGGTSPIKYKDHYLSFFHSSLPIRRGTGKQYFMGAYLFEAKPPFVVKSISIEPIIAGDEIPSRISRLDNKIYVVFPGGVIRNENSWSVCFGYNDYENRIIEVTDEFLNQNLISLEEKLVEA